MTQWKDREAKGSGAPAAMFIYPCLMASDILLYDASQVPAGSDQRQHVELARNIAVRFNSYFGDTFTVPEAIIPHGGARIMDLVDPTLKMSKSTQNISGAIYLDDSNDEIADRYAGQRYGAFKAELAESVIALITPLRDRVQELMSDYAELAGLLSIGSTRARETADLTLTRVRSALGV